MAPQPVFQLRIRIEEVTPTIWRRLLVPGGVKLPKLHDMFQAAMGWTDSHLHSFTIGDELYGMHFDDWPDEEIDEKDVTVLQALQGQRRFTYEYDFGDSWIHEVVVEDLIWTPLVLKFGVCLDGQNACPPEDVGGVGGYELFREAMADPTNEDHEANRLWVGFAFDPEAFDLAAANAAFQRVR
ncbi:MAG: plasmid pRiA4b ORF-3 family protein [Mycobacterium sp.]